MNQSIQTIQTDEQEQPTHYEFTTGGAPDCLLHPGAYVAVSYASYYGEDSTGIWGKVEAFTSQWLLLTRANGSQILINLRHVESIEPLQKQHQRAQPAPKPTRYNSDMTSDTVPF